MTIRGIKDIWLNRHLAGTGILFLLLAVSCGPHGEEPPAGVVSDSQMVRVLVDFHLARSRWQAESFVDGQEIKKTLYYQEVLDRHGITYAMFQGSINHYALHPEELTQIYDKVIEELSRKQAEAAAG